MTWNLLHTNYATVKSQNYEVAVLPLGATEPHNLHLPYGTDVLEGTIVGEHICQAAAARGASVVLLPTLPYGTETNLREFPLALNLNPSTLFAVVTDLVDSLVQSGLRKIVLLNSHGGNELKPLLRELYGKTPAHLFLCNWYQCLAGEYEKIFTCAEDHAGEMETSFGLAFFPEWVGTHPDGSLLADAGETRPFRLRALEEGWVSITRPWHLLTTNSGAAPPHAATAEKGHRMMEIIVDRLAEFLVELSAAPLDSTFPFAPPTTVDRFPPEAYTSLNTRVVVVAQLDRAPDCGSGGRGFESPQPPFKPTTVRLGVGRVVGPRGAVPPRGGVDKIGQRLRVRGSRNLRRDPRARWAIPHSAQNSR